MESHKALFLDLPLSIYINDLHKAIKHSSVYHFADDTNLLNINTSPKEIQKQIKYDLKCLYKWLLANKISLNCSKTELIIFHKPGYPIQNFNFKIKTNGDMITPTDHIKYLGVYLDSKEELKSIYYAIFSSHMVYGCQIWEQSRSSHVGKIFKLQNRALRIINVEDFHANLNPLYINNKILKLQDFIRLQNCLFVHDYLNNVLPACFDDYYFKLNYLYFNVQTRNSNLGCLFSPSKNTTKVSTLTQKSIYNWNSYHERHQNRSNLTL